MCEENGDVPECARLFSHTQAVREARVELENGGEIHESFKQHVTLK
jgi:hypothetical protein